MSRTLIYFCIVLLFGHCGTQFFGMLGKEWAYPASMEDLLLSWFRGSWGRKNAKTLSKCAIFYVPPPPPPQISAEYNARLLDTFIYTDNMFFLTSLCTSFMVFLRSILLLDLCGDRRAVLFWMIPFLFPLVIGWVDSLSPILLYFLFFSDTISSYIKKEALLVTKKSPSLRLIFFFT